MALREEFHFLSSDGVHQIHGLRWLPQDRAPRATVQLVHGISEYMGRYDAFARFLADHGFAVATTTWATAAPPWIKASTAFSATGTAGTTWCGT